MHRLPRCLSLVCLLALVGCSTGAARSTEALALAARDYHDALLYGDFQVIATYLTPAARADFLARAYGMEKRLSVLEFTPIGTDLHPDGDRARMVTRLSWYELPSTVVQTENVFLFWKRVGQGIGSEGRWMIERIEGGPLPVEPPEDGPWGEGSAAP